MDNGLGKEQSTDITLISIDTYTDIWLQTPQNYQIPGLLMYGRDFSRNLTTSEDPDFYCHIQTAASMLSVHSENCSVKISELKISELILAPKV